MLKFSRQLSSLLSNTVRFSVRHLISLLLSLHCTSMLAGPWVDTDDLWLRQDIELLADAGIIKSPITTYPLMWSNIAKDIDHTNIEDVPTPYKESYWRVKKKIQQAFKNLARKELRFSASSSPVALRSFGSQPREEFELSAIGAGISQNWAWKTQLTYVTDPLDGDEIRPDGSYLSSVWGNWVLSAGWVDKWWGPSWNSAHLVSNNARPFPALMLQRNYASPFESDWLAWIGPWSLDTFFGQLDDDRFVDNPYILGASITFKPIQTLEIGLRRTAQWGGEGRPTSVSSLIDLVFGRDNCGSDGISCENNINEPGNQIAGIDIKWRLFEDSPFSLYTSIVGEDEAGYLPAKKVYQLGLTSNLSLGGTQWRYFIEYSDTSITDGQFDILYEHHIYRTGYRYNQLSIGSTYDNDSETIVLGIMTQLDHAHALSLSIQHLDLNQNAGQPDDRQNHTLSNNGYKGVVLNASWRFDLQNHGDITTQVKLFDEVQENEQFLDEHLVISLDWRYPLR